MVTNIAFRSATGAMVVWSPMLGLVIAHKLGDTWYDGAYAPVGFVRTPVLPALIDYLEAVPVITVAEALAAMAHPTWCGSLYADIMPQIVATRSKWWAKITDGVSGFLVTGFCTEKCMEAK